jgi:predicted phosphodiesterase
MKIAIITDVHANLPALKGALNAIDTEGCDFIFHVGDSVAIGPYPAECVDLIWETPNIKCVVGNHELYFVKGLPEPQPSWMSEGEMQHQRWTHRQLGDQRKSNIAQWPFTLEDEFEGVKTIFMHYGLTASGDDFQGVIRNPGRSDLDRMFGEQEAEIVFFGHERSSSDIEGKARYINPGSLGCNATAMARYTIAEFDSAQVNIQHRSVWYDDKELYETFEKRNVPEREFIYKVFFGGRFGA